MVSVNDGHISFHGLPVHIISEIGIAITAFLADAPEKVRPSLLEIINHCFEKATTEDAVDDFLEDSEAYAQAVINDTEYFSLFAIFRDIKEDMKAMKEQQEDGGE